MSEKLKPNYGIVYKETDGIKSAELVKWNDYFPYCEVIKEGSVSEIEDAFNRLHIEHYGTPCNYTDSKGIPRKRDIPFDMIGKAATPALSLAKDALEVMLSHAEEFYETNQVGHGNYNKGGVEQARAALAAIKQMEGVEKIDDIHSDIIESLCKE